MTERLVNANASLIMMESHVRDLYAPTDAVMQESASHNISSQLRRVEPTILHGMQTCRWDVFVI